MTTYQPYRTAQYTRPAPEPPARDRFRPDIEGLRAVAVLLVVANHAGLGLVHGGYVGVDVFFVISGFLITLHLFKELQRTGRIGFGAFYGRRIVRLLPASTVVLVTTVAAAWTWMSPVQAKAVVLDALSAAAYGINIRLAVLGTDYLSAELEPSPLQHFWSLAVEEQFYFIWPLLLVVAATRRASRRSAAVALSVLGVVSFAVCVWQTGHSQPWAYFGIQARAWELAAGALIALAAERLRRLPGAAVATWAGVVAIVASAVLYDETTRFPGTAALLPVAGAALVIAGGCAQPRSGAVLLLGLRPMQAIGKLSYSWYLWHWPALMLAPHIAGDELGTWTRAAVAAGSLLPAWLSLRLVENRVRFNPVFKRRPRRGLGLGVTLTALACGASAIFLGLPNEVEGKGTAQDTASVISESQQLADARRQLLDLIATSAPLTAMPQNLTPPVTAATNDRPQASKGCLASLDETSIKPALAQGCDRHGDPQATTTLVLFGDSHTEQWFDAVDAVAKRRHWRLVVLTKSGCTPADAYTIKINARRAFTECATWREEAFAKIKELKPALVLLSTRTYGDPPVDKAGAATVPKAEADTAWAQALMRSAKRVADLGARPVIMQDTPDPRGTSVPDCVAAHPEAVQQCALKVATAVYATRRTANAEAAQAAGYTVIDPTDWFCTATVCPVIIGNALVYRDGSHVTTSYVKLLTPLLQAELVS
ncbi:acyltransferase [Dactylosporangium aurantiacum]|uniref:Acyltransferase n=1 Tax=Dactylosporangium aurantiacum TaxID=35754 RepID=A0A9Q9IBS4_9ACTN|nr:acyltransferase family protein [Dactylosporangium aurantiacum]MDG6109230.1 acyltransferase family protein [Dactylosporangium aurantiacum]UWZ50323.1 acyltransferase [Dactylosporangium aurantiacum]